MPKYQNGFSNLDVKSDASRVGWRPTTPLGNLIGVTNASERMDSYNRQFSDDFAKYGSVGGRKKPTKTTVIVVHKQTKTVNIVTTKVK